MPCERDAWVIDGFGRVNSCLTSGSSKWTSSRRKILPGVAR